MLHTIIDLNEVFDEKYGKLISQAKAKGVAQSSGYGVKYNNRQFVKPWFSTDPFDYLNTTDPLHRQTK